MTKIGYLIPEFPGQTHAFFMREREELAERGIDAALVSTRLPRAGAAEHAWAASAQAETTYLTPLSWTDLLASGWRIARSGPAAWVRCLRTICSERDLSWRQKAKLFGLLGVAGHLVSAMEQQGCDHVHIHSCADAAWLGVFAAHMSPLSYSLTLHGPLHDYGLSQQTKWRFAEFVVVITRDLLEQAKAELDPRVLPELVLAPMGVNVNRFRRSIQYQPPCLGRPLRIVSCGRLNPCKGHDDLIRTIGRLRERGIDASLTICGAVDGAAQPHADVLRSLIDDLGLKDDVELAGSVSEERVRETLEQAHVFCLASHKEPLGVATMEAMAMELPVVVTESPGVLEMIDSGQHGCLVPPRNPAAMTEAIVALLEQPERCVELGRAGRERVVREFHSGRSAEMIAERVSATPGYGSQDIPAIEPALA